VTIQLSISQAEKALGEKAKKWENRCYEIAQKLAKTGLLPVGTEAVYGHWIGAVHSKSSFYAHSARDFASHGWCVCPDGTVVDPTRWVFEWAKPYIFIGKEEDNDEFTCKICHHHADEHRNSFMAECAVLGCRCPMFDPGTCWPYDEGGNQLRRKLMRAVPKYDPKGQLVLVDFGKMEPWVRKKLADKHKRWTSMQLHWLATLPYEDFEGRAFDVYKAIRQAGHGAVIPIDNERRAKRERNQEGVKRG
jgi:hypothetical protein